METAFRSLLEIPQHQVAGVDLLRAPNGVGGGSAKLSGISR